MSAAPDTAPLVEMRGIAKRFPGVQALDGVDFDVRAGELHGLAGENGSGKSTLMKILAGRYKADEGTVLIDGEPAHFGSPSAALRHGVALIAQEVLVHPALTVAENLRFGRPARRRGGAIDWRRTNAEAQERLDALGLHVRATDTLGSLALHHQHMVAIAKLIDRRPRVLMLDEPTSSLAAAEVATLFGLLRELRAGGTSIVYITHRLSEYFELADRMTVLRDGRLVTTTDTAALDEDALVRAMVGRDLGEGFRRTRHAPRDGTPALRLRDVCTDAKLHDVSLEIGRGEIVGVAGQAGAGRSTLARALFGRQAHRGTIEVDGREVRLRSARDAMRAGIGYVPEDRKGDGLVLTMTVRENLTMPLWPWIARRGVRRPAHERRMCEETIERLRIRTPSTETLAGALSGGNQQKIVIAKWLAREPRVLVLDEPTRGVDVGAKAEIYELVGRLAESGMGVLLLSSELPELLMLSDRIVVMAEGRVVGEQQAQTATEESLTALAFSGLEKEETA